MSPPQPAMEGCTAGDFEAIQLYPSCNVDATTAVKACATNDLDADAQAVLQHRCCHHCEGLRSQPP
jgi:hypothetical protein